MKLFIIFIGISAALTCLLFRDMIEVDHLQERNATFEKILRFESGDIDDAWFALMPEVTVTASRYEYEDDAWTGLMPEILVTAPREDHPKYVLNLYQTGEDNQMNNPDLIHVFGVIP